jgi:hypothetical protein
VPSIQLLDLYNYVTGFAAQYTSFYASRVQADGNRANIEDLEIKIITC